MHALSGDEFLHEISQYLSTTTIEMDAVGMESPSILCPDLIKTPMEYKESERIPIHG